MKILVDEKRPTVGATIHCSGPCLSAVVRCVRVPTVAVGVSGDADTLRPVCEECFGARMGAIVRSGQAALPTSIATFLGYYAQARGLRR